MTALKFDGLTVLSRVLDSDCGCAELCRTESGEKLIRVRARRQSLQECLLLQTDREIPVRCTGRELELLFPWQEGKSLREWLLDGPDLARRRQACFELLEQVLTQPIPPDVLALSAREEDLRFGQEGLRLQLFPDFGDWSRELGEKEAVRRTAELMVKVLYEDLICQVDRELPEELELLRIRSESGGYESWSTLQSDLYRIPDQLPSRARRLIGIKNRIRKLVRRCVPVVSRMVVAVLVLAALVSGGFALLRWKEAAGIEAADPDKWPGITQIGLENLAGEEEAP